MAAAKRVEEQTSRPAHDAGANPSIPPASTQTASHETADNMPPRARRRVANPFGGLRQKLAYAKREGYHRHWFNDTPGRLKAAEEGGYSFVKNDDQKNVSLAVGTNESGQPLFAFLMEIPQDWYDEDMRAQQNSVDEIERSIQDRGNLSGVAEGDRDNAGEKFYIPKSRDVSVRHGAAGRLARG